VVRIALPRGEVDPRAGTVGRPKLPRLDHTLEQVASLRAG
jgi:hypothetical protein